MAGFFLITGIVCFGVFTFLGGWYQPIEIHYATSTCTLRPPRPVELFIGIAVHISLMMIWFSLGLFFSGWFGRVVSTSLMMLNVFRILETCWEKPAK